MTIGSVEIAQGHNVTNTPGTSTVFSLDHDTIKIIPADRKITCAHIVVVLTTKT